MREIKFRAWLKDDKKMVEIEEIHFRHQLIEYYDGNYAGYWLDKGFDKIELMQYTGLKDKNGKEIYEGDIVQWCHHKNVIKFGEIVGYGYGFYWESLIAMDFCESMTGFIDEYEVIGNIYQNRELLEENYE